MITMSSSLSIFMISLSPKNHHMKHFINPDISAKQGGLESLAIFLKVTQIKKIADP